MPCPLPLSPHAAKDLVLRSQLQLLQNSSCLYSYAHWWAAEAQPLLPGTSSDFRVASAWEKLGPMWSLSWRIVWEMQQGLLWKGLGMELSKLVHNAPASDRIRCYLLAAIQFTLNKNEESHLYHFKYNK